MSKRKFVTALTLRCGSEHLQAEVLDLIRVSAYIRKFYENGFGLQLAVPAQFGPAVVESFLKYVDTRWVTSTIDPFTVPEKLFVSVVLFCKFMQVRAKSACGCLRFLLCSLS